MPRAEMLVVFTYDVSDNRRRRKLAATLEDDMVRVQLSVFEAWLDEAAVNRLARSAASHLGPGDSLRVYSIGADGFRRSQVLGAGAPMQQAADYWLV